MGRRKKNRDAVDDDTVAELFCSKIMSMMRKAINNEESMTPENTCSTVPVARSSPICLQGSTNSFSNTYTTNYNRSIRERDEVIEKLMLENKQMKRAILESNKQHEQQNNEELLKQQDDILRQLRNENEMLKSKGKGANSNSVHFTESAGGTSSLFTNAAENMSQYSTPTFSFKDVEDSLNKFSGDDDYGVEKWIDDVNEAGDCLKWSDMQKLIYGKRLLCGSAKQSLRMTKNLDSWRKLCDFLMSEFNKVLNEATVHKKLMGRKLKSNESLKSYLITMREIGATGEVSDDAIIQYCIDGIPDYEPNKAVLYGATDMTMFKDKLEIYEEIKKKTRQKTNNNHNQSAKANGGEIHKSTKKKSFGYMRCYGCGDSNHVGKNCPNKSDGPKCYNCNKFGHLSKDCLSNKDKQKVVAVVQEDIAPSNDDVQVLCNFITAKDVVRIIVNNCELLALVDSGSHINIMSYKKFLAIGAPNFESSTITFIAAGPQRVNTIGKFFTTIFINGEKYQGTFHIVDDNVIPVDIILGRELMDQTITIFTPTSITIKKFSPECMVNVVQEFELDLSKVYDVKASNEVRRLIVNYHPNREKKNTSVQLKLVLKNDRPIAQRPRRLSPLELDIVRRQVNEWLEEGVIQASSSEYASPVVLANKKDGTKRLCIDFRKLNEVVVKDRFPIPIIEDEIAKLDGATIFTTLDLRNGFFHVPVHVESRKYTAFVTPFGLYEFLVAPFGLCNSPAVFMRFIASVFHKLIMDGVISVYLDDVLIFAKNMEEAMWKLKMVLSVAEENGLEIKWSKCQFLQSSVEYLGYEISGGTIRPSEIKTKAIQRFPIPSTLKKLQSFLGLTSYFRKFVENYALIARPLTNLLRKGVLFEFKDDQKLAFEKIKMILTKSPVLKIYSIRAETELHTDACKLGLGAILLQKCVDDNHFHPIFYYSKKTSPCEERYCSYELEVLAIVTALKKFRVYLLGLSFKIVTDCEAFKGTMERKELTSRIAGWALQLQEFDYVLEHRPGTRMRHVDALSRQPVLVAIADGVLNRVMAAQKQDADLNPIFQLIESGGKYNDYIINRGCLFKVVNGVSLIVVPRKMYAEVIKMCHEQGHFSVKKTEELVRRQFFIPKMVDKIKMFIANCITCIMTERKGGKKEGFLNPIPKGDSPLVTYHVDHLGGLVATKKQYRYVFGVVDGFSKFVWLYPTKTLAAKEVIQSLNIQKAIFGNPHDIVADRHGAFRSQEFVEYCESEKIELLTITTGVPRGNGQIERIFRTVIPALTKLSVANPEGWYKYLNDLQRFLNNSFQRSIAMSPFELLIGTKMRCVEEIRIKEVVEAEMAKLYDEDREVLRAEAKKNIQKIQDENRKTFNKKRKKAESYRVGDMVMIKRTQFNSGNKLQANYLGPYEVVNVRGKDRYDVRKVGGTEGPNFTSTCSENMKLYYHGFSDDDYNSGDEVPSPNCSDDDESAGNQESFGPNDSAGRPCGI